LALAEDGQSGVGVVNRPRAQPQSLGDQLVGSRHYLDVSALTHRFLLIAKPVARGGPPDLH
jgi:hypothetical protein